MRSPSADPWPDDRVALSEQEERAISTSPLYNADLAPIPLRQRTWSTYNYAALWIAMSASIPVYLLAAGLITLGMGWSQAVLTIFIGNVIVLLPILANSHAGTRYGIPFPVYARASFGVLGANVPAVIRGLIACGWFGIQAWIGGQAVHVTMSALVGDSWAQASEIGGHPWTMWVSFAAFWVLNIMIIVRGMNAVKQFENWAAPALVAVVLFLLAWMLIRAEGLGPVLDQKSEVGWGADFWKLFFPSLMGIIAFNATLSLNIPDFTRFGGTQRSQIVGQTLGLPTAMTFFPLIAVFVTSASAVVFGSPIWDPVELVGRFSSPVVIVMGLFAITVATLSTNVAANVVSPANDFSNIAPRLISFKTGGVITGVIALLIQPWRLLDDPDAYVFAWLGSTGGLLGAMAGVLIADYWFVRRAHLKLADLYLPDGVYRFSNGFNWRALVATAIGGVLAVGGAYSSPGKGPYPEDGLIPFLQPLYDYGWVVGIVMGALSYVVLMRTARTPHAPAGQDDAVAPATAVPDQPAPTPVGDRSA